MPKQRSNWKNRQYKDKEIILCFWCDKELTRNDATVDHILSSPIMKDFDLSDNNKYWCISCERCNVKRACITKLYSQTKKNLKIKEKELWIQLRNRNTWNFEFFSKKIKEKVNLEISYMALYEINMVKFYYENISIRTS